ncbi:23S rRNA (adenine(2030)-N(6))-methyltransferase RlmJ [Alteromonas halophila]|uniref:Ribosomal RNA large subunit methyltransferase J n=1 Tax=Alteromonas halophila TaxID=516698 RepID=A0A918JLS4_9ALTE|nr:23S rRNA (adenine(2030)-N(6))-methyltransferase RlmJ [Alteromonas halophila]GGW88442.1 ribosomal RNA large subunit methyltransferase J [Alteromonas halophila]
MLSYKHAFHAGNFADVLKHLSWLDIIGYLEKKPKPFTLYDTHSGAGLYQLNDADAQKTGEYKTGIGAIQAHQFSDPLVKKYLNVCQVFLGRQQYPGSPLIALSSLARKEAVELMELHPTEYHSLKAACSTWPNAHVHHRDGLEGIIALTPPPNKRGAILIDPAYEQLSEYTDIVKTVSQVLRRWRNATIVIWYPRLSARAGNKSGASEKMVNALAEQAGAAFTAELTMTDDSKDAGMYGTGVLVLNPPWESDVRISAAMQEVVTQMPAGTSFACHWLKRAD